MKHDELLSIRSAEGRFGCIDCQGQVVIAPRFVDIEFTEAPDILMVREGRRRGYIDRTGGWISDYIR